MISLISSLVIMAMGVALLAGSQPLLRLATRHHAFGEQVGADVLRWLARALGVILGVLGVVSLLQL